MGAGHSLGGQCPPATPLVTAPGHLGLWDSDGGGQAAGAAGRWTRATCPAVWGHHQRLCFIEKGR